MLTALEAAAADVTVGDVRLAGDDLRAAVLGCAERLYGAERVAVITQPTVETVVAVAGALTAGCTVIPINPAAGAEERTHMLRDSSPDLVIDSDDVDLRARSSAGPGEQDEARPAFVVYTSGTTGRPKGVVVPRSAVVACLDGLATVWSWDDHDTLAHALPMFHVHGLVLGTLGPLRHGSRLVRTERFQPVRRASIYFAVPTMWARTDDETLPSYAEARLLVSGSAALPAGVFSRVRDRCGRDLVERYGLTESLIVTAADPTEARVPGQVGRPLPGVQLRVADADDTGLGEVQLRGPTLFTGYLNRPDASAAAYTDDGWFRTGDLGRHDAQTGLRLMGRLATDLIKTGGFKVGAGEVEDALLAHPAVAEAAVIGVADDDLGERIVAYVVADAVVTREQLTQHVTDSLAPHKRPREVHFRSELPRNAMGKLQKAQLRDG